MEFVITQFGKKDDFQAPSIFSYCYSCADLIIKNRVN